MRGLDPAKIQAVVRKRYGGIRKCYEDLMHRVRTGVQGRVTVQFHIAPPGDVVDACIWDTELQDGELSVCILENFESLDFGVSDAQTTVRYPIVLMPSR